MNQYPLISKYLTLLGQTGVYFPKNGRQGRQEWFVDIESPAIHRILKC
jgi:hypothetical protein